MIPNNNRLIVEGQHILPIAADHQKITDPARPVTRRTEGKIFKTYHLLKHKKAPVIATGAPFIFLQTMLSAASH
ncbi:hypothetical protein [Paenibacillus rhizoplanae]|uniref:Uncharacterized protein n=1 Tax=Paenibacillus rhizoplanae TaxID=1917181 RepID=A0ABW5FFM2_9BACL